MKKQNNKNRKPVSSKIGTKIQESMAGNWLGIANLILTAIIGIGLAIFFKLRDESFQTNVMKLQSEMDRQSKLAHIDLYESCFYRYYCGGSFTVVNSGPANANNLRITLTLTGVQQPWDRAIKNIDVFPITIDPPSIQAEISRRKINLRYGDDIDGNNTIDVVISTLPPNQQVELFVAYDENMIATTEQTANRDVFITTDSEMSDVTLQKLISDFLERKYEVALFDVNASCENCEGEIPTVNIYDSADSHWGISELISTSENGKTIYQTKLSSVYRVPSSTSGLSTTKVPEAFLGTPIQTNALPLHLTLSQQPDGPRLIEDFP